MRITGQWFDGEAGDRWEVVFYADRDEQDAPPRVRLDVPDESTGRLLRNALNTGDAVPDVDDMPADVATLRAELAHARAEIRLLIEPD